MQWRGQTLGAVNLFFAGDKVPDGAEPVTRAFSDIATVVVMQSGAVRSTDVVAQLRTALTERIVIEQAKGVLAYTEDLTVDAAFERLLRLATEHHRTLSEVAAGIIDTVAKPGTG
jgi:AmiR/NasT family two-component response regulator